MARFQEVPMPERPRGTPEEQAQALYRYMWRLAEELNLIIEQLNKEDKNDGEQ